MSTNQPKQDQKASDHKAGSQQSKKGEPSNQTPKEENEPRDRKK